MAGFLGGHSFGFLFRRDEGLVDQRVWWAGTLLLTSALLAFAAVWGLIGGWAVRPANPTPLLIARTGVTYVYLFVFAAAVLLISISQYNLSAKRLRAVGLMPGLAALLPLACLLTGAVHWAAPAIGDAMPWWGTWLADIGLLSVLGWNVWQLGISKTGG